MIIIRISGGVGNQLFQYAMGRALSLRSGHELKLDVSFYELGLETDRPFKLSNFNVPNLKFATVDDFRKIGVPEPKDSGIPSRLKRRFYRDLGSFLPLSKRRMIEERTFAFYPEILEIEHDCYLVGVWQSEKYFSDYADKIREEFRLLAPLSVKADDLRREMDQSGSIALHVRRGDQVHNAHLLAKHGYLGDEYYGQAVDYITKHIGSCRLFIFSDEIEWCKENLRFNVPTVYVEGGGLKDYEEMALMSSCAHNIIAKSSFSWWGAWLNRNPDKIVIAPRQRFGAEVKTAPDLYPDSWIKI